MWFLSLCIMKGAGLHFIYHDHYFTMSYLIFTWKAPQKNVILVKLYCYYYYYQDYPFPSISKKHFM